MLELFMLAAAFAGGYAASVLTWPSFRAAASGVPAEIASLRARAAALEAQIAEDKKGAV